MVAYYVTHPYMDRTAVIYAPSTEKARTTFLDWLERNGLISRKSRQTYRRDMVAEKLEDPGVPSDIVLHYGGGEERQDTIRLGEKMIEVPIRRHYEEDAEMLPEERERIGGPSEEEVEEFTQEAFEDTGIDLRPKQKRMPIQEVMLKGFE